MDVKSKVHPTHPLDREAKMSGVGATAIWDGPFDSTGYPKGKEAAREKTESNLDLMTVCNQTGYQ